MVLSVVVASNSGEAMALAAVASVSGEEMVLIVLATIFGCDESFVLLCVAGDLYRLNRIEYRRASLCMKD